MAYSSLKRGLAVLEHIANAPNGLTVTAVSRLTGSDMGSTSRLLAVLNETGFVRRKGPRGPFVLGARVIEMGLRTVATLDVTEEARPVVEELSRMVREMAYFAIRSDDRVMPVISAEPPSGIRIHNCLGATYLLHCSAAGKICLAHMSPEELERMLGPAVLERQTAKTITSRPRLRHELGRIRRRGYAVDNEETVVGFKCVAAPVLDFQGQVAGALGITGFASNLTPSRIRSVAPAIKRLSGQLSRQLGYDARPRDTGERQADAGKARVAA